MQKIAPFFHWIPKSTGIPCEVVMPNASISLGIAEDSRKKLSSNEIIQFERFGFVRIDEINEKMIAYFAHR